MQKHLIWLKRPGLHSGSAIYQSCDLGQDGLSWNPIAPKALPGLLTSWLICTLPLCSLHSSHAGFFLNVLCAVLRLFLPPGTCCFLFLGPFFPRSISAQMPLSSRGLHARQPAQRAVFAIQSFTVQHCSSWHRSLSERCVFVYLFVLLPLEWELHEGRVLLLFSAASPAAWARCQAHSRCLRNGG